jgi:L-ascorbate metabolism protein UlaG (beta-lactamase superfamily)
MKRSKAIGHTVLVLFMISTSGLLSRTAQAALTFRWIGVSGFTLTDGKTTLLFDPAVTPTPLRSWALPFQKVKSDIEEFKYWASRCEIKKLDATFVNHTHTDHAIDAPTAVNLFGGLLAGSTSLRNIGLGHGIPENAIRVLKDRDTLKVGDFQVQAFTTPHSPHLFNIMLADGHINEPLPPGSSPWDYRVGETRSYWVTHPEGKILFQAPGRVLKPDVLAAL